MALDKRLLRNAMLSLQHATMVSIPSNFSLGCLLKSLVFCGENTVPYSELLDGWPGRYTSGFAKGLLSLFPDV